MGSFSNTALRNPSGQYLVYYDLQGYFSKHPIAPETGSPAYTRTRLAQSSDLEIVSQHRDYSASLSFFEMPHVSHKQYTERSSEYLIHLVKFTNSKPRNNIENKKKNRKLFIIISKSDLTCRNAKLI